MSRALRLVVLGVLGVCGAVLVAVLYHSRIHPPLESTLTTSFQILGVPVKLADRVVSRVLPVSDLDERSLGDVYHRLYGAMVKPGDPDQRYLDQLTPAIKALVAKPFPYRAYVVDYGEPNAMALPGGTVLVTRELLRTLHSEAELMSVLAHEFGHIERGHCFDTVRFQLLARKVGAQPLGTLADMAGRLLFEHAYAKSLEHEADDFAFTLLTSTRYDPRGEAAAFRSLEGYVAQAGQSTPRRASPLRDYFTSHPPLEIRADEFAGRANAWWGRHPDERRYVGRQNLVLRTALAVQGLPAEWTGRALTYSHCPGSGDKVCPHMEMCTNWRYYHGELGTQNACGTAVVVRFLFVSNAKKNVIDRELKPGEVLRSGLSKEKVASGWYIFTTCPAGYFSSVPLEDEYREAIRDSQYDCVKK